MGGKRYYVSLYILIPIIYTGISILGVILTYQLFNPNEKANRILSLNLVYIIAAISILTYLTSVIITRFFLKPFMQFVEKTKKIHIFTNDAPDNQEKITDELENITKVFDNVANILSSIEAKELFPDIIGASAALRNIFTQITKVAPTDTTVLITGESGTGKELVAQAIYEHSPRLGKPFIKFNCIAIPEGLLESELFGHEKGAFTGAVARKKGKFELADGGTIFLDEIGDMALMTQAKILRVLQEREFERVGGTCKIQVDVRIIVATNKNLTDMVKGGTFREDLFYRLNVFNINLPPLRERREDIPALVKHFIGSAERATHLSSRAMQLLLGHSWPGNIRELQNVIERAEVIAEGNIEPCHLPPELNGENGVQKNGLVSDGKSLDERLSGIEMGLIIEAITRSGGSQARAAQFLGINQRSLWHRIKKYNIDVSSLKNQ